MEIHSRKKKHEFDWQVLDPQLSFHSKLLRNTFAICSIKLFFQPVWQQISQCDCSFCYFPPQIVFLNLATFTVPMFFLSRSVTTPLVGKYSFRSSFFERKYLKNSIFFAKCNIMSGLTALLVVPMETWFCTGFFAEPADHYSLIEKTTDKLFSKKLWEI